MKKFSENQNRGINILTHEYSLAFAGLCVSLWIFFPGWLSADSVSQLTQAYSWSFNDWHPVIMAMWWGITASVLGPSSLLLQQLAFYWAGWGIISKTLSAHINSRLKYFVFLGFIPTFLLPFGHIWKDNQFASIMFFATSWLIEKHFSKTKFTRTNFVFLLALMIYAVGVKPNGAIAVFLILIWATRYVTMKTHKHPLAMTTLSGTLVFLAVLSTSSVVSGSVDAQRTFSVQASMIHDIQGIAHTTGMDLRPEYSKKLIDFEKFSSSYQPDNAVYLVFLHTPETLKTDDPVEQRQIQNMWLESISTYPVEYLTHRSDVFLASLRVGRGDAGFVANGFSDPNSFGFSTPPNPSADLLIQSITFLPFLYWPWVGLVMVLGSIGLGIFRKVKRNLPITMYLSLIYLSFLLPHYAVIPSTDYRYYLYSTLLTPVILALTWSGRSLQGTK